MKIDILSIIESALVIGTLAAVGCSSTSTSTSTSTTPGDMQTPVTGTAADIDAWIATGDYKAWHCEAAPHAARSPSPHGGNRICSNDLLSAHGAGEYPVGAASVKELYDTANTKIVGYAMARKMSAGGGDTWYWYEVNGGVVANGLGVTGTSAGSICVGCHSKAEMHAGHDLVYTQVK